MNTTQPRAELVRAIDAYVRLRRGELTLRDDLVYLEEREPRAESQEPRVKSQEPEDGLTPDALRLDHQPADPLDPACGLCVAVAVCSGIVLWSLILAAVRTVVRMLG